MAFKDLREFIATLESAGELLRIKEEVDWKYEVAGWTRYCYDCEPRGPALLFENIKEYPGHRIFTNGLGSYRRMALALGLPANTAAVELIRFYCQRQQRLIPPRIVAEGPVHQNVSLHDRVDLFQFPAPWWMPKDAGRFIGTWHACISRNAVTGVTNLGMYRLQLLGRNQAAVGFAPGSHLGLHYRQREERGEPLEMAVAIGVDETIALAALTRVPEAIDEYELAGGLRGEPVEVAKCKTLDLYVPASAEIVLEGTIAPFERRPEGPFGEHTGYHAGGVRMRPVFYVSAVNFRNNPILRGQLHGKPVDESHIVRSITTSATGMAAFQKAGPPGVITVFCPPEGDSVLGAIIQMKPYYVGHSRDVGRFWLSTCGHKYVVIVDDDIDPFSLSEVWWAITTRTRASRDFEVLPFGHTSRSDPSAGREGEFTDYLIIDATKKLDYPYVKAYGGHWAPVAIPPKEVMDLIELKWRRLVKGEPVEQKEIDLAGEKLHRQEKHWEAWRSQAYQLTEEEQRAEIPRSYPRTATKQ